MYICFCGRIYNKMACNCTYPCEKKNNCKECVEYHKGRGEFPACFFSAKVEKSYDRSFENLVEDRK